jgi:hypothetical protein
VDSDNLYAFNGFDPVNFVDPWGLEKGGRYCTDDGVCELADPSSRELVVKGEKSRKPICEGCILDRSQLLGDGIGGGDEQPAQPPAPAQPEKSRPPRTAAGQIAKKKKDLKEQKAEACIKLRNCAAIDRLGEEMAVDANRNLVRDNLMTSARWLRDMSTAVGGDDVGMALIGEDERFNPLDAFDRLEHFVSGFGSMAETASAVAAAGGVVAGAVRGVGAGAARAAGGGTKALPAPRVRGKLNPIGERGTFYVDPKGNVVPTPPGGRITGSPDGRFIQARDAAGNPTGVRIDGPHRPTTHPDPRAQQPHGHVPGVTNSDGTPWLPINE